MFWTGYCNKDRIIAISEIERIVNLYGYITDFNLVSDISIVIHIEVDSQKTSILFKALEEYLSMNEFQPILPETSREVEILLNVTFTGAKGDLRIEVPAVPG